MEPLKVVDFHNHFVGPGFALTTLAGVPQGQRAFWEAVNGRLSAPEALFASLEEAGVSARVINTPLEFLHDGEGRVPPGTVERINDSVAELVHGHPGRLHGLATIDAYAGEAAAAELGRAVKHLGLRGVFMESAKASLLPDAPEARPTLAAAAALGVPVFLHPVADAHFDSRFRKFGRLGVRLTRGTINSAALFALLEGGVFEELRDLRVVVTALAFGGVLLAAGMPDGSRLRKDVPGPDRRHVYIDTTGMDRVGIRGAIETVGADHVLTGTDWPVVQERSVPARLQAMFDELGLGADERRGIAGQNALRLLKASGS
jgi:predicted TIM-barrel fold metal-dependent hydrolase